MKSAMCLPILTITLSAHAAIYQWRDDAGGIHYSDQKPGHARYRIVEPSTPPVLLPPAAAPATTRPVKTPPAPHHAAPALSQPDFQACAALEIAIDTLERTEAVYRDDKGHYHTHRSTFSRFYDGSRQYISDRERPALLSSLKNKLGKQCGHSPENKRALSLALGKLIRQRYCALLEKYYSRQANPRLRIPDSELLKLRHSIDGYCRADSPDSAPKPVIPTTKVRRD